MKGKHNQKGAQTILKSKTGRKNKVLLNELPVLKHQDVHDALMYVEDILERAQIPFFLLDEIAKKIWEDELPTLNIREIDIGILEKHLTDSCYKILKMIEPTIEKHHKTYSFNYKDVPVILWIINSDYDVFRNPDFKWYTTTQFRLPNPFKIYWNKRDVIVRGV